MKSAARSSVSHAPQVTGDQHPLAAAFHAQLVKKDIETSGTPHKTHALFFCGGRYIEKSAAYRTPHPN
jgi:hypothetical protein